MAESAEPARIVESKKPSVADIAQRANDVRKQEYAAPMGIASERRRPSALCDIFHVKTGMAKLKKEKIINEAKRKILTGR